MGSKRQHELGEKYLRAAGEAAGRRLVNDILAAFAKPAELDQPAPRKAKKKKKRKDRKA